MSEEITIQIEEQAPINITLDDGCQIGVSIDGVSSSVYWQDVLNKPDFDSLYYPLSNPSGFVTGSVVRPSETGQFYLASNPSGFITGAVVRPDTYLLRDSNSVQSLNWQSRVLFSDGLFSIGWADRNLYDSSEQPSLDWSSRILVGSWSTDTDPLLGNDLVRLSYLTGAYYPRSNPSGYVTGSVVRPSDTGAFYPASNPSGFVTGIDASNFVLKSETGAFLTTSQTGQLTGAFYPYSNNPAGYVTGSVVRPSETGTFLTSSQSGAFYPSSNPSGFITGVDTGSFVLKSETGIYTGLFYPLLSNPSGYVTGSVVRPSETGSFLTTSSTGQFYPSSNPSGFITGVDTSNFVLNSQTGSYTGLFYPLSQNPSGYVTGNNVVRKTDDYLYDDSLVRSVSWRNRNLFNSDGYIRFVWEDGTFFTKVGASGIVLELDDQHLIDSNGTHSVSWDGRILADGNGSPSVFWQNRLLMGSGWSLDTEPTGGAHVATCNFITGYSYPLSTNPSGYVTGQVVRPTETGSFITSSQTGQFYPMSNPSGFATGIDSSNFVLKSETGAYTGQFYPRTTNPSGYVTGSVIRPSDTGSFITTSQTGAFYPRSNPSGFVSDNSTVVRTNVVQTITHPKEFAGGIQDALGTVVLSPNTQTLINAAGFATVDWNAEVLTRNDTTTSVNWENSTAYDAASNPSVYWSDRVLADSSDVQSVNWDGRILLDSAANYSIDFGSRILYSSSGQETVNWDANTLKYLGVVAIDWSGRILNAGAWTHNFTPSSDEHIVNLGYLTGYSYPRSSNPSGYVTGNVVRPSETGALTDSFYPLKSNPSGYVTGSVIRPSDTGVFVSQSQTGSLTGVFYPLSSNPSSYVTGLVVRPNETGAFATTGWVNENYYPRSNPSGYSAGGGGLTQQQTMAIASLQF